MASATGDLEVVIDLNEDDRAEARRRAAEARAQRERIYRVIRSLERPKPSRMDRMRRLLGLT